MSGRPLGIVTGIALKYVIQIRASDVFDIRQNIALSVASAAMTGGKTDVYADGR